MNRKIGFCSVKCLEVKLHLAAHGLTSLGTDPYQNRSKAIGTNGLKIRVQYIKCHPPISEILNFLMVSLNS